MGKTLIKYLYLLNLLLIVGTSGLYANSGNDSSFGEACYTENSHDIKHPFFHANHHDSSQNVDLAFALVKDLENEEASTKDKFSINKISLAQYNVSLFNKLSFRLQKDLRQHDIYYDKSPTKLHVRIQVFRI